MKCALGISNFLQEISSLSHSVVFLYFFALIAEEGLLISPCCSWALGSGSVVVVHRLSCPIVCGILHAKMGTTKDRNGMDLTEAEDIKKRWQEYTELNKKSLNDPENHNGVITHLKSDILECVGSNTTNKASGGDGIPAELFQILKDDAVKVLHSVCHKI